MHLSCLPQGSKDTANCDHDCVSREQALVNTTSGRYVASCCCKGMFCNSLEGRSINITVKEYEGILIILYAHIDLNCLFGLKHLMISIQEYPNLFNLA